jgi:hypothetical protein
MDAVDGGSTYQGQNWSARAWRMPSLPRDCQLWTTTRHIVASTTRSAEGGRSVFLSQCPKCWELGCRGRTAVWPTSPPGLRLIVLRDVSMLLAKNAERGSR